jgi:hypothetical protein
VTKVLGERGSFQFDGNSDGKRVASSSREELTVNPAPKLTINPGRRTQHPWGPSGDRRVESC